MVKIPILFQTAEPVKLDEDPDEPGVWYCWGCWECWNAWDEASGRIQGGVPKVATFIARPADADPSHPRTR